MEQALKMGLEDDYDMSYPELGTALIFNHKNFHPTISKAVRRSTEVDRDRLKECLLKLGFVVKV